MKKITLLLVAIAAFVFDSYSQDEYIKVINDGQSFEIIDLKAGPKYHSWFKCIPASASQSEMDALITEAENKYSEIQRKAYAISGTIYTDEDEDIYGNPVICKSFHWYE